MSRNLVIFPLKLSSLRPRNLTASLNNHPDLTKLQNIGNEMVMDDGLPNHERMGFWQKMPVYWNANREGYKPAPPIVWKNDEL